MQAFVIQEKFQTHIKKDGFDLDKIEEQLRLRKDDILKTEWPVVIAGEQIFYSLEFDFIKSSMYL